MKNLCVSQSILVLLLVAGIAPACAQTAQSPATSDSYGFRQRAVIELKGVQREIVSLAQAMPAEKYTWRPAEGVRSVSEVYLHIAGANFGLTAVAGAPPIPPPPSFSRMR